MDAIPTETTVLVVGGGPGGSYAASAIAREGVDTVLLEADVFPRYHVGESMVASIRHFLRFIDLDTAFSNHGFVKKTGAAFKLNSQREAYTDFVVNGGPDSYAWNVLRSESDDLMFRHAGKSGAKIFDGVKVDSLEFRPTEVKTAVMNTEMANVDPGRPVSASWSRKDGSSGEIKFDYLVDASGRAGIVSTKYLKNRTFNQELKNVANWGYWKGAIPYAVATPKEGQPLFEALQDGSGWAWFIPLHNGTTSVGIVMNQAMSTDKKRAASLSGKEFYMETVKEARRVWHLLSQAELSTDIKYASDWSYSAGTYGSPYVRIVGDAGAFIDPYFSSGVHLALSGALSAAVSICASIRGDCDENTAWKWHSSGVAERYTRFLLVVLGATKQIRSKDAPVMQESGEDNFDRAFSIIRPVIQGRADVADGKTSAADIAKAVDFTYSAVQGKDNKPESPAVNGASGVNGHTNGTNGQQWQDIKADAFTNDEAKVLKMIKDVYADYFSQDTYDGRVARVERGNLGLVAAKQAPTVPDTMSSGNRIGQKQPAVGTTQMQTPAVA